MALLDVQVACLANQASNYLAGGVVPRRMGNAHPNIVPYQDFPTADGDMILAIGNDGQFAKFCAVADHPEWATDERFATNPQRVANRAALIPLLRQATVMRSTHEWIAALEAAGVPCGPINRLDEVFADPQVQARGLRIELPHPNGRQRAAGGEPDPAVGVAGRISACAAAAGPAHRRGVGGMAGARCRCARGAEARCGDLRGGSRWCTVSAYSGRNA